MSGDLPPGNRGAFAGPFCGCLGCGLPATHVIEHPEHGERRVCPDHIEDYEVKSRV